MTRTDYNIILIAFQSVLFDTLCLQTFVFFLIYLANIIKDDYRYRTHTIMIGYIALTCTIHQSLFTNLLYLYKVYYKKLLLFWLVPWGICTHSNTKRKYTHTYLFISRCDHISDHIKFVKVIFLKKKY